MEKTTRYAEIPQLKGGAVFSDPSYAPDVWCCYQRRFHPSSGWAMRMETTRDSEGVVEFALFLGRRSTMSGLRVSDDGERSAIHHYAHHQLEARDIGADTARVFVGSMDVFERYGEEASIYTAADGLFGELHEISCKGEDEPCGFLLMGAVDGDITDEDELFRTVVSAFDGHEIERERFEKITSPDDLEIRKQLAKKVRKAKSWEKAQGVETRPEPEKGGGEPER